MKNEEVVMPAPRPGLFGIVLTSQEKRQALRYSVGTVFGVLLFAAALLATGLIQFRMRMPGYIVMYWFPALMAGRALSGYRGSGLIVSPAGGMLANVWHPAADSLLELALAALVVEGIMLLIRQNPNAWLGILMGMAASVGKMVPKVFVILTAGSTPHHNLSTLPFMLESYLLFGALAGFIYVGGLYLGRKAKARIASAKSQDNQ